MQQVKYDPGRQSKFSFSNSMKQVRVTLKAKLNSLQRQFARNKSGCTTSSGTSSTASALSVLATAGIGARFRCCHRFCFANRTRYARCAGAHRARLRLLDCRGRAVRRRRCRRGSKHLRHRHHSSRRRPGPCARACARTRRARCACTRACRGAR